MKRNYSYGDNRRLSGSGGGDKDGYRRGAGNYSGTDDIKFTSHEVFRPYENASCGNISGRGYDGLNDPRPRKLTGTKDLSGKVDTEASRPANPDYEDALGSRGFSQPASRGNNHPRYNTAKGIKTNRGIDKGDTGNSERRIPRGRYYAR
jgi:hypothetical protein